MATSMREVLDGQAEHAVRAYTLCVPCAFKDRSLSQENISTARDQMRLVREQLNLFNKTWNTTLNLPTT